MRPALDPVAMRSEALFRLFNFYLRMRFASSFHAVRLSGSAPALAPDRPVIVFGNHPSWWDPALYLVLAEQMFRGRPGYGPMEAEALARYGFFRRLGIFGIEKDSAAGARRFLEVSRHVLAGSGSGGGGPKGGPGGSAMIWVTAEGGFTDSRQRPVRLRRGIAHLARAVPNAVLLPLAVEYAFWNESKPELLIRFGAPLAADPALRPAVWAERLERALGGEMDALAADSMSREKARFSPVLRGSVGSSLIYDQYRRLRARLVGKRFSPAHEEEA